MCMIALIKKHNALLPENIFCQFFLRAHLWFIQLGREVPQAQKLFEGLVTLPLSQIVFDESTEGKSSRY